MIPGGRSPESPRTQAPGAADGVASFDDRDKPVAAIRHGAQLLILAGREATGDWPLEVDIENAGAAYVGDAAVVDGNLITSRVPDDLPEFMSGTLSTVESATVPVVFG